MSPLFEALVTRFGAKRVRSAVPLSAFTTFRVGGPADWFLEPHGSAELADAIRIARSHQIPVTLLGGGSNVLIADSGIRGLVLRCRRGEIRSEGGERGALRADAAVTLNGLVRHCVSRGLSGLEAWAGTPGTVGGGISGNAHFQGRLLSEHVLSCSLLASEGEILDLPVAEMDFGYDRSRLHKSGEVLLSAVFRVGSGDSETLRQTARASLAFRKRTQPLHLPSAGCLFQNPDLSQDVVPEGIPWSAGALIDRAGLKGMRVGAAAVSEVHANFVVNLGGATAADIDTLARRCQASVRELFGVSLKEEIVRLGEWACPR